jgi:hypothetical protein
MRPDDRPTELLAAAASTGSTTKAVYAPVRIVVDPSVRFASLTPVEPEWRCSAGLAYLICTHHQACGCGHRVFGSPRSAGDYARGLGEASRHWAGHRMVAVVAPRFVSHTPWGLRCASATALALWVPPRCWCNARTAGLGRTSTGDPLVAFDAAAGCPTVSAACRRHRDETLADLTTAQLPVVWSGP